MFDVDDVLQQAPTDFPSDCMLPLRKTDRDQLLIERATATMGAAAEEVEVEVEVELEMEGKDIFSPEPPFAGHSALAPWEPCMLTVLHFTLNKKCPQPPKGMRMYAKLIE